MSAKELLEWSAFEQVAGPVAVQDRVDLAAARICWVIASALGDGSRQFEPDDFMPVWGTQDEPDRPKQSVDDMIAVLRTTQRKRKRS